MYGWRLKIGLMVPAANTTMESEFWRMVPAGVSVHVARVLNGTTPEIDRLEIERAAKELAAARVDVIAYGCTAGSHIKGHDQSVTREIASITGVPCLATSGAVLAALHHLGISKVAVATPYTLEINRRETMFLEDNGICVARVEGLGLTDETEIGGVDAHVVYRLVKKLGRQGCDGILVSGTNLQSIEIIEMLEAELLKPIVSSNQATLADVLKTGWVNLGKVKHGGSLFKERLMPHLSCEVHDSGIEAMPGWLFRSKNHKMDRRFPYSINDKIFI